MAPGIKMEKIMDPANNLEDESEIEEASTADGDEIKKKKPLTKAKQEEAESDMTKQTDKTKDPTKKKVPKIRNDVQEKILAYMGQELETDRKDMSKQEVAENCGFAKAGSHSFFYAWQDLERNKKYIAKSPAGKALFRLTDLGKDHIPRGIILVPKRQDNAGKQEFFLKALVKQCNEAVEDKVKIMFEILSDGQEHDLEEFIKATGYANLKSKGLGYTFTHMMKKMKILEKLENKTYRFTDKCFPEGRPKKIVLNES